MDTLISYLEANLTTEEFRGYLKGSIAAGIMVCEKGGTTAHAVKRYTEKLLRLEPEVQTMLKTKANEVKKSMGEVEKKHVSCAGKTYAGIDAGKVRELYIEKGMTSKECCRTLKISESTFRRVLKDNGIIKQPKIKKTRKIDKALNGLNNLKEKQPTDMRSGFVDSVGKQQETTSPNNSEINAAAREAARDILGMK